MKPTPGRKGFFLSRLFVARKKKIGAGRCRTSKVNCVWSGHFVVTPQLAECLNCLAVKWSASESHLFHRFYEDFQIAHFR